MKKGHKLAVICGALVFLIYVYLVSVGFDFQYWGDKILC